MSPAFPIHEPAVTSISYKTLGYLGGQHTLGQIQQVNCAQNGLAAAAAAQRRVMGEEAPYAHYMAASQIKGLLE